MFLGSVETNLKNVRFLRMSSNIISYRTASLIMKSKSSPKSTIQKATRRVDILTSRSSLEI
jgi:hypothetical protein